MPACQNHAKKPRTWIRPEGLAKQKPLEERDGRQLIRPSRCPVGLERILNRGLELPRIERDSHRAPQERLSAKHPGECIDSSLAALAQNDIPVGLAKGQQR